MTVENKMHQPNSLLRWLLVVLPVLILCGTALYFTTEWLQKGYQLFTAQISTNSKALVTYYQWTDSNGGLVISREQPDGNQSFITFQGSADLQTNKNIVDQKLVERSENYRVEVNRQSQTSDENSDAKADSSSIDPINALNKAKLCTQLSSELHQAQLDSLSSNAADKTQDELKARLEKECIMK